MHYRLQMIASMKTISTPILGTACFTMYFDVCEGSMRDLSRDASGFIAIPVRCPAVRPRRSPLPPPPGAYPLTKQHFQLKNDIFAFKMGNNVNCYLLLPCLLGYGKHLPAYQIAFLLRTR